MHCETQLIELDFSYRKAIQFRAHEVNINRENMVRGELLYGMWYPY